MIQWLVQTRPPHLPTQLLAAEERGRLARLRIPKRRRDWLLGRLAAKRLLRGELWRREGRWRPLSSFVVRPRPSGAPGAFVVETPGQAPTELPWSLSISHRGEQALSAVSSSTRVRVGADLERVEPRTSEFVRDFFTVPEQRLVERVFSEARDELVAAIWSSKEAVLKALELGLTVDTRRVCCLPELCAATGWRQVQVACDPALLGRASDVRAWWHVVEGQVRTLAAIGLG